MRDDFRADYPVPAQRRGPEGCREANSAFLSPGPQNLHDEESSFLSRHPDIGSLDGEVSREKQGLWNQTDSGSNPFCTLYATEQR